MKYNFVHLSDLHFRAQWEEENDLVCDALLADIQTECKGLPNTFIAFTGDLVFAADDDTNYSQFLEKFSTAFDKIGLDRSRRFSIPGNHDVQRGALQKDLALHNGALSGVSSETSFNNSLPTLTNQYFATKFANYKSCEAAFAQYACCMNDLGGAGWELPHGVGVYCLNTALTSCAGLDDASGKPIIDKERLAIDTRHLYRWVAATESKTRILLAHHPLTWLQGWAQEELERIIANSFHLVMTGHVHSVDSFAKTRTVRKTVFCAAPALFTRKTDTLGYAIVQVDTATRGIEVKYRQWANHHRRFVAGAVLAGTDSGIVTYSDSLITTESPMNVLPNPVSVDLAETQQLLDAELKAALLNYSSKPLMRVERDIADLSETDARRSKAKLITPTMLAENLRDCVVRAPHEFGLSCVGRKIAFDFHKLSPTKEVCIYLDYRDLDVHKKAVEAAVSLRRFNLKATEKKVGGFVVDGWKRDHKGKKLVTLLRDMFQGTPIALLESVDIGADIERAFENSQFTHGDVLHLWALTQNRIRSVVQDYVADISNLDPEIVTRKIVKDIDALNIFRTPSNCLMFLRLAEQAFDDSPVNRTELIHRVLFLLFYRFDQIPTYARRPDLKDCEYVLGHFCEHLIKNNKYSFTKHDFFTMSLSYCSDQFIDVDIDILFAFLVSSRLLIFNGSNFQFRFKYWMHYFAAHRMHHNPDFASFVLGEGRYASMPEIIEFYTGIDRRRSDAVTIITRDLERMAARVSERTKISPKFEPFAHAKWKPSKEGTKALEAEIKNSIASSSLPPEVRDTFADRIYDKALPYSQEIATFVDQATLLQMFHATKGAARALRNSDHVAPQDKVALLTAVMNCWNRVAQVLSVISPVLASQFQAHCEGMSFVLIDGDGFANDRERWLSVITAVPTNIVNWFEDDLYSSKLCPLFFKYLQDNHATLQEVMLLMVLIRQRPDGWTKPVKQFITTADPASFGLLRVFSELRSQRRLGLMSDGDSEQINHLSEIALAKHSFGSDAPNRDEVRRAASHLGNPVPPSSAELRHSKGPKRNRER